MLKKILFIFYSFIVIIDKFLKIFFKKSIVLHFLDFINLNSYKDKKIEGNEFGPPPSRNPPPPSFKLSGRQVET